MPDWCEYGAIKIVCVSKDDKLTISGLTMKASGAITVRKKGLVYEDATQLYQQPLSLNIGQMAAGFTFESEQNEASWLNPLTTLILRTTQI